MKRLCVSSSEVAFKLSGLNSLGKAGDLESERDRGRDCDRDRDRDLDAFFAGALSFFFLAIAKAGADSWSAFSLHSQF